MQYFVDRTRSNAYGNRTIKRVSDQAFTWDVFFAIKEYIFSCYWKCRDIESDNCQQYVSLRSSFKSLLTITCVRLWGNFRQWGPPFWINRAEWNDNTRTSALARSKLPIQDRRSLVARKRGFEYAQCLHPDFSCGDVSMYRLGLHAQYLCQNVLHRPGRRLYVLFVRIRCVEGLEYSYTSMSRMCLGTGNSQQYPRSSDGTSAIWIPTYRLSLGRSFGFRKFTIRAKKSHNSSPKVQQVYIFSVLTFWIFVNNGWYS
jgi:hypothetical protein